jgi:urease accessory protein
MKNKRHSTKFTPKVFELSLLHLDSHFQLAKRKATGRRQSSRATDRSQGADTMKKLSIVAATLLATSAAAEAHTGLGHTHSAITGFLHPVFGVDHVLAMVAVGLFAVVLGGRALWAVPASFVTAMAIGGGLGVAGIELPFVETAIALSVIVLGAVVALQWKAPTALAATLVAIFAIFHGHAHGAEMPVDASGFAYAAGFMIATALLHITGIALGVTAGRIATSRLVQASGAAMSLAGIGLLGGWV